MHIVLVEPEIPPNTGNIARLCAVTRSTLHLVEPLGFSLDRKDLKRAGMDYWEQVEWRRWRSWSEFYQALPPASPVWLVEAGSARSYTDVFFGPRDYLVFGRETAGLPRDLLEQHAARWISIPMFNPAARSLNLSNAVAIVLYEALRQEGFPGAI